MDYNLLNEIDSSRDDWVIRVQICRIWQAMNLKLNNKFVSLDMIIIDEQACCSNFLVTQFLYMVLHNVFHSGNIWMFATWMFAICMNYSLTYFYASILWCMQLFSTPKFRNISHSLKKVACTWSRISECQRLLGSIVSRC